MKITGFTGARRMAWYGIRSSMGAREWESTIAWEADRELQ